MKILIKEVIKVYKDGQVTFKDTWDAIIINKLIKLSEIKDFDELDMNAY